MLPLVLAFLIVVVIVLATLFVHTLWKKAALFLSIGAATAGGMHFFIGETSHEVLHHVFLVDYPQFIFIPLVTVLIASLGLLSLKARVKNPNIGWFLLIICPLVGNFMTTWGVMPIGLSLAYILKQTYPKRWLSILMTMAIFCMNFMALGTLSADPPQALLAVKADPEVLQLDFFWTFRQFWVFLGVTWVLYGYALKKQGVKFGHIRNLVAYVPTSWPKALYGVVLAALIAFAITELTGGYTITWFLGGVFLLGAISSIFFGKTARHQTLEWCGENVLIFVAFFSAVALAMTGIQSLGEIPLLATKSIDTLMTWFADNAAAFAAVYDTYNTQGELYLVWCGLFDSVTQGGVSPLGNGPQIGLFLIILVSLGMTTVKEVFVTWFKESIVYLPYLIVWSLGSANMVEHQGEFPVMVQLLLGIIALGVSLAFMSAGPAMFRTPIDAKLDDDTEENVA
jgi:hypothetical protein